VLLVLGRRCRPRVLAELGSSLEYGVPCERLGTSIRDTSHSHSRPDVIAWQSPPPLNQHHDTTPPRHTKVGIARSECISRLNGTTL
jgi:hypothetical protein